MSSNEKPEDCPDGMDVKVEAMLTQLLELPKEARRAILKVLLEDTEPDSNPDRDTDSDIVIELPVVKRMVFRFGTPQKVTLY
jgi:hypothetical protein